jgi:uncharacterized SAM-binding protein YcdF (DUF218 family)
MPTLTDEERYHALVLWGFHCLQMSLKPCEFILAMGSHDERVAEHAASLFVSGLAPLLVTSGGFGKVTRHIWNVSEGERFANLAEARGVPRSSILVEDMAGNTGDNITLTRSLLSTHGIQVRSGILVTKPYMMRRAYATATKQWSEIDWCVSAPAIAFEDYPNDEVPLKRMISLMVGDLQRLKVYADQNFQSPQEIPNAVWDSYEYLKSAGYSEFVIRTE